MLLVRILGVLDFLTGVMILLYQYEVIGMRLFFSFIFYLLAKGIIFRMDFASFVDIVISIYMIFMLFLPIPVLTYIAAIYLFQKSASSILM
jgi:hypothetical protein